MTRPHAGVDRSRSDRRRVGRGRRQDDAGEQRHHHAHREIGERCRVEPGRARPAQGLQGSPRRDGEDRGRPERGPEPVSASEDPSEGEQPADTGCRPNRGAKVFGSLGRKAVLETAARATRIALGLVGPIGLAARIRLVVEEPLGRRHPSPRSCGTRAHGGRDRRRRSAGGSHRRTPARGSGSGGSHPWGARTSARRSSLGPASRWPRCPAPTIPCSSILARSAVTSPVPNLHAGH